MSARGSLVFMLGAALSIAASAAPAKTAPAEKQEPPPEVPMKSARVSKGEPSLPWLLKLTEENSPLIRKAEELLHVAEMEKENARAAFFPTIDLDLTHGVQDASSSTRETPWASGVNLVMNENLWDGNSPLGNWTKWRIAKVKFEKAKLEFEEQRDQQLLSVAQAYYDWSNSVQQRRIDESKRDLLRRQFNVLEAQYKQRLKTKRDVLRIETEIRRMQMAILGRDNEVDLGFQKLAGVIGVERAALEAEKIQDEEPPPPAAASAVTDPPPPPELKAADNRKARILDYARKQSELEAKLARWDYLPQALLRGSVGYHNHDYIDTSTTWEATQSWDWSALLILRYNLWDFGTRRRNQEIARVKARNIVNDNTQTLLNLDNDLRDVWNKLREFREDVRMSRELLTLEQQSYSILEAEYRNGRASYLDLITNLNSWIDARSKYIDAYFGFKKQQAAYSFHKGEFFTTPHAR
jgi:outer membrane protein TolC